MAGLTIEMTEYEQQQTAQPSEASDKIKYTEVQYGI